jgi:hypothetical protein
MITLCKYWRRIKSTTQAQATLRERLLELEIGADSNRSDKVFLQTDQIGER